MWHVQVDLFSHGTDQTLGCSQGALERLKTSLVAEHPTGAPYLGHCVLLGGCCLSGGCLVSGRVWTLATAPLDFLVNTLGVVIG